MTDRYDEKIDEALGAWPDVEAYPEDAVAAKTMNRIRANFPPKSKLSLPDDALFASPLPAAEGEGLDPDATERTSAAEIRQIRPSEEPRSERPGYEKMAASQKSSENDVPMGRSSSIPPPSSGVSRSEQRAPASNRPPAGASKREDGMGQVERQRERTSFKDLAKLAATPPPPSAKPSSAKVPVSPPSSPAKEGDSGVVDLQAAALSDPHAAERAKTTPLASGSLFEDDAAPHSVPPPSLSGEHRASGPLSAVQSVDPYSPASVRPSAPPSMPFAQTLASAGPHSAQAALAAAAAPQKKEEKGAPVVAMLGGLLAAAGIAAGVFFYVHHHPGRDASLVAQGGQPAVAAATQAPAAPQTNADPANAQPTTNEAPQENQALVAQNDVTPAAVAKTSKSAPVGHTAKPTSKPSGGATGGGNALADAMEKDTASTPPTPPPAADTTPAPAAGSAGSLKDAMQTAAGPSDSTAGQKDAPSGPKFAPGSVPQRPSQGALASAIGRVLPEARACLGPDDGVSYATIVFESAGGAQNVTLSGFAANKPAGSCITTALKKASVGPFAEPTYSAKVTVRP